MEPDDLAGPFRSVEVVELPANHESASDEGIAQEETDVTAEAEAGVSVAPPADELGWPDADRSNAGGSAPSAPMSREAAATPPRPPVRVETDEPRVARRDNPLIAGLIRAMRQAALASREETTARLRTQATARVEVVRAQGTDEALALRKNAEEDIAGIREWSKTEIARVRQRTEERIEERRAELERETEGHAAKLEEQIASVETAMAQYEAEMDRFFERLLAEEDPARLATLAEQAPETPELDALADLDVAQREAWTNPADAAGEGLEAEAAAAAEAEAVEGIDLSSASGPAWPAEALAGPKDASAADGMNTQLVVMGLRSVAAISAFKSAVAAVSGVNSVSVSSGETGAFLFAVAHDQETDLADEVTGLPGFAAEITEDAGTRLFIKAHEPAA
jgi:hypothetical protein